MISPQKTRRVLLVGHDSDVENLLAERPASGWDTAAADSSAAAAFIQQSHGCELVLATQTHYRHERLEGIGWLARQQTAPILLLADLCPAEVAQAYERGVSLWLPRQEALQHPRLLTGAMLRLALWAELQTRDVATRESLDQCHRQVDRLVALLWRAGPLDMDRHWYTHRHMLERLNEELARANRHGTPLTIALGEVQTQSVQSGCLDSPDLVEWLADRLVARKRSCDIIGQYGRNRFLLLMTHTPLAGGINCCRRLHQYLENEGASDTAPRQTLRAYFGVAGHSPEARTAQRLLRYAEEHLDAAKHSCQERIVGDAEQMAAKL
jgi:diguanylate cyclase (GGDEF)-like protein